jgi:fluoroquinolone transport system permease protein
VRFLSALKNDILYQIKYGFYLVYAFISALYAAILFVIPAEYKSIAASVLILTDPAMLGIFFIGGIWLLEKREGLHGFWLVSPLRTLEYILSKAVSLAIISAVSADLIALIGLRENISYIALTGNVFAGSLLFTIIGLITATYAQSVNQYMLIATPPAILLSVPPILRAFGYTRPLLECFPGTALWRLIADSVNAEQSSAILPWIILLLWLTPALFFANKRVPIAMAAEAGERI